MRVVEINKLTFSSELELEVGATNWYLQLLHLACGFFEYRVSEQIWYVSEVVEQLLDFDEDSKESQSLYNNESINEIVENFLLDSSVELTQDVMIRHKHKPWETLTIKCEKIIQSEGSVIVRGLLIDSSAKKKHDLIDGQLTSGVSHDFNNQLNGILGYVALMKTMTTDETLLRYMDGIERSVRHSTELTRQLLNFSHKPENKRMNLDLVQIVKDTVNMLKHTIDRRIRIELNVEPEDYYVLGDESQLNNAILNLCINARDAIARQGEIRLSLTHDQLEEIPGNLLNTTITPNHYAILKVSDTGSGIEESLLPKIFKPFFTTKDVGKGTGMGLASVVETLRNHNGALEVDSVVNR